VAHLKAACVAGSENFIVSINFFNTTLATTTTTNTTT
jgi:hypothetical protein